jgi:hypothetical protein
MRLLHLSARAAAIACFAIGFMIAIPAVAAAQERAHPELDSAPAQVPFRSTAVVNGHMENGTGEEKVTLQKYKGGRWINLQTKSVDDEGEVSFRLEDLTRTADYRLRSKSPDGDPAFSNGRARIRVEARVTLSASRRHVMSGRKVTLSGSVLPKEGDRRVILQKRVSGEWRFQTELSTADGRFSRDIRLRNSGRRAFRVLFRGDESNSEAADKTVVDVYDPDPATWYGPGFYGNRTACGKRLRRGTLGVAHRSLPCGTKVSLLHRGRTITVEVIDRGPYSRADWDLTEETADRLRFEGSRTIGVAR